MPDRFVFDVDSAALARVNAFVAAFAERHRLVADERARLVILIEELVTNLDKYGYPEGAGAGWAEIALALDGDRLIVEFVDDGVPFDPASYRAPGLDAPLDQRPDGLLGLQIVQHLADELTYRRDGNRNWLRLVRRVGRNG
jgi:serine/threonine-protein kinase RsbW